ncbi:MAG: protein-glutamate O-methyltransferase CheR [Bacteroidota bacterium]
MNETEKIAAQLKQLTGIEVDVFENSFLEKSLERRISETKCRSATEYGALLEKQPEEATHFIDSLQICYSEFFRNPLTFAVLEQLILPFLIAENTNKKNKELRVWTAACAAGQETYSVAMLLQEFNNGKISAIPYRIFATDQSELAISEAKQGVYSNTALNNLTTKRLNQWFTKQDNGETNDAHYTVLPLLKNHIDFSVFNLLNTELCCPAASIFGNFDLVVCCNLLFYYKAKYRKLIFDKIAKSMASGAFVITGETERDILIKHNYREVFVNSAIFIKR